MTDDDPIDLGEVAADDEAVEALRRGRRSTDVPGDPALAALHQLLRDVGTDLPEDGPQARGLGSSVLPLSGDGSSGRRVARSGTAVALIAAGVLSLGGVAAASTVAPPGSPLHDLGQAVRAAAGAVVTAVTPPDAAPSQQARPTPSATSSPGPAATSAPGSAVSAAARSAAAAGAVAAHLDAAQAHLDAGRARPAEQRLDAAERRLAEVLPADGADALRARLAVLRTRLAETGAPAAPRGTPTEQPAGQSGDKPAGKPTEKPARGGQEPAAPDRKPAPGGKPPADADPEQAPGSQGKGSSEGQPSSEEQPEPRKTPGGGQSAPGQLSRDASAKPRA